MKKIRMFQTPRLVPAAILLLALCLPALPQSRDKNLEPALKSISAAETYDFVRTLASPEYAGRLTGDAGYTAAAKWAARKYGSWGLKPISLKDGFLQAYPSPCTIVDKAEMTILLPDGKPEAGQGQAYKEMRLAPGKEFLPLLFSDSGDRTAEAVFAGWGISAPELNYDDYAGLDVRGKFVLCFRGTPDRDVKYEHYDEHRTRMKTARDKGALGLVYIYDEISSNPNGDWLAGFTPAMINEKVMDAVLKEVNSSTSDLKKSLTTFKRPVSFPLQAKIRLVVGSRHLAAAVGYNVAGYIEGSDPALRNECLVIGGHFDHCGRHLGLLFAGADDNASGSATVMEIAKAFAALGRKPKRSVLFVLFGGEEMGLQGSTYFVNHVPAPFTKVDAMFNFDMTGEGDGLWGGVSAEPAGLKKVFEDADKSVGILRGLGVIRHVGVRGSDFAPFFEKGIPSASLGSNGPHLAYHQTGDTIFRINPEIMAAAVKVSFLAAYSWADR
ncbi:MAG: M20/M25/M40 family metallo-hydrolase [Acidobacteriota bacterium]